MPDESIIVLDFGSQYSQLIVRRLREAGVYSELLPFHASAEQALALQPRGICCPAVRPASTSRARRSWPPGYRSGTAGAWHLLRYAADRACAGRPRRAVRRARVWPGRDQRRSSGVAVVRRASGAAGLDEPRRQDRRRCRPASTRSRTRPTRPLRPWAMRRAAGTASSSIPRSCTRRYGRDLLRQFRLSRLRLPGRLAPAAIFEQAVERIRAQVGDGRVICGLSGGVDSAVAAALIARRWAIS